MNETIIVKYDNGDDAEGYDLTLLGESFAGMSSVFKQLSVLTGIDADIAIKTTKITHGSVEVHTLIQITFTGLPFSTPQALFDFLQVVNPEMCREAKQLMSGTLSAYETLESYLAAHPLAGTALMNMTGLFFVKAFKWARKQKYRLTTVDPDLGEITVSQASKLRSMVTHGKFRRMLKPLTQGNVRVISAATVGSQSQGVIIGETDIESYLPEDDQVLPEFENGTVHTMNGMLQNLQSARGEILKIRVDNIERSYSLITARPHDGQTTEDYLEFYHRRVRFTAEVVRVSMYKRPEFVVREMALLQQELPLS